jgi:regulatory protein
MTPLRSKSTEDSSPERAWLYALRLLAARDYTEARLREKLSQKQYSREHAEQALNRLVSEGWINDRRYAERFAETALASGRFYGQRLKMEMRKRGIPDELLNEVVGNAMHEHDESEEVVLALVKRFPGFLFSSATDSEKRRVLGFLQRKGFGFSVVMQAMKKV